MSLRRVHPDLVDSPPLAGPGVVDVAESDVLWEESVGQVVNAGWFCICLLGFWLVVPLLITIAKMWSTSSHRYQLTSQRLRESRGVLIRDVEELELYRVKDLSVQQPLLQRLLGRGRIVLITSDRSTPRVVLNAISDPVAVADLIRQSVEACRVSKGVREID